jgi:hypothetical protein
MAKRFLVSLDLGTNELQNAVIQNLPAASQPTGVKGRVYFDSTNNKLKVFDGTTWQPLAFGANAASTVTLTGDVAGTANVNNGVITIETTVQANSVALGIDTTGNYVNDITAGTGVTVTHTPSEGSSPTVAIGQAVGTTDSPSFAGLTLTGDASVNGGDITTTAGTASIFNANATTINLGGAATSLSIGSAIGTTTVNNDLVSTGDVAVNGGDLTTTSSTASLFNSNATTLNIGGSATTVSIGGSTGNTTVNNNLIITGNLTVEGETTTLNTATLLVEDNIIVLNKNVTGSPSLNSGITVERGESEDVSLLWNETNDSWTLTNNGTNYHSIVRKYIGTVTGDDLTNSFQITHSLGTRDVQVQIYPDSSPYETVEVDVERYSDNRVDIKFAAALVLNVVYKVIIVG